MNDEQLKVDAETLWDYGAVSMPAFAEEYSAAVQKIYDSTHNFAYQRSGITPPAFDRWIEYRDLLQSKILRETAEHLHAIGKAMERYAFEIASLDGDNSDLIEYARGELSETGDYRNADPKDIDPEAHADEEKPDPPDDTTDKEKWKPNDSYQQTEESRQEKQQDHMGNQ